MNFYMVAVLIIYIQKDWFKYKNILTGRGVVLLIYFFDAMY